MHLQKYSVLKKNVTSFDRKGIQFAVLAIYEIRTFPFNRTVLSPTISRYLKLYEAVFEFLPPSKLYTVYFRELNADIFSTYLRSSC